MSKPADNVLSAALEGRPGKEYNEAAFRYFLALERARADRSNHPLRLLLATVEPAPGKPVSIDAATAARLFAGLRLSLRDTDVMGWYRQHRVAAAVLAEPVDGAGADVSRVIQLRVVQGLRQQLPAEVSHSLRVRTIELRPRIRNA